MLVKQPEKNKNNKKSLLKQNLRILILEKNLNHCKQLQVRIA